MLTFTVDIEGFTEFEVDVAYAAHELDADLLSGAHDAADYGVRSMQENHPYTDRTRHLTDDMFVDDATGPDGEREADMVIPADYARYVDEGTSRSLAYPFTPLGEHTASEALDANSEQAVARFVAKISR